MNRWRVILAAAVIFLAGAGTGAALMRTFAPKVVKRAHDSPPLPIGHARRQEYISKLDHELQLTSEQRIQVEAILAESQKRMKQIWEPLEPQVKEEYKRTRKEISAILTAEQQAKMKSWHKDKEDRGRDEKKGEPDQPAKSLQDGKPEAQRRCSRSPCA